MNAMLDFDNSCPQFTHTPAEAVFIKWTETIFAHLPKAIPNKQVVVGIRIVDEEESTTLNNTYRHKNYATNVLSFTSEIPAMILADLDEIPVGDLAICAPVVEREASEQDKPIQSHWAHMVVHGLLHLHGYDHIQESDAEKMEALEREILAELGIPDPYLSDSRSTFTK